MLTQLFMQHAKNDRTLTIKIFWAFPLKKAGGQFAAIFFTSPKRRIKKGFPLLSLTRLKLKMR